MNIIPFWILLIPIFVIVLLYWITTHNRFIRLRNDIKNAFGTLDAILKQRFDLLPNLVETVKKYAQHESETFIKIAAMRSGISSYDAMTQPEKNAFNRQFDRGIHSLFSYTHENYPELKASTHFMHLQRTLNELEEQLAAARRTYNAVVTEYNNAVQVFPSSIIASLGHFNHEENVLETAEEERQVPNLRNLFN